MKNLVLLMILMFCSFSCLTTKHKNKNKVKVSMKSKTKLRNFMKVKLMARENKLFKSFLRNRQQEDPKLLEDGDLQFTNEQLQDLIKEFQTQLSKQSKTAPVQKSDQKSDSEQEDKQQSVKQDNKQEPKQDTKQETKQDNKQITKQDIKSTNVNSNLNVNSNINSNVNSNIKQSIKQDDKIETKQQSVSNQPKLKLNKQIVDDKQTIKKVEKEVIAEIPSEPKNNQDLQNLQKRFKNKQNDDEKKDDDDGKKDEDDEKKKKEKIAKMSDEQKAQEYPNDFYWEYARSEDRTQNERDLNRVAQQKFEDNPKGSDSYSPIGLVKDGQIGLILSYTYRTDNNPNIQFHHLMLNDHNLFFLQDENSGYRGVLGAIKIANLYHKKIDDVRFGQCCESIGIVKAKMIGDLNTQQEYQCFQVDDHVDKQSWQVCSNDGQETSDWRQTLIMQVILYGLRQFGIYGLDQLMKFQKQACLKPTGWNYEFQSRWPCMCPEGMLQSPIDIDPKKAVDCRVCQLFPKYEVSTSIVVLHKPWESYIENEFGRTYYRNKRRKRSSWLAQSVRFKFPAEHLINGTQYPAEMQVFHTDGESKMALSVLITNDPNQLSIEKAVAQEKEKETTENTDINSDMATSDFFKNDNQKLEVEAQEKGDEFMNQFMFDQWDDRKVEIYNTEQCVEAKINITKIFDAASTFSYSFYSYQGSDSEPPCNEDVQWVVMKDRLLLSSQVFNRLKEKVIGKDNPKPNARDVMPPEDRDIVSHDECKKFTYPSPEPGAPLDAQYVKAKATLNYYAIVYPKTRTIFDDKNNALELVKGKDHKIKLEYINEDQMRKISPKITQDLRFQLGEWLVNNRDKIMQRKMQGLDERFGKDNMDGQMETDKPDI